VWAFLALYSVWMWGRRPQDRVMVAIGLVLIPLLWIGIPALTARSPFVAGNLAQNSPRELKNNKFFGTFGRFFGLQAWPVELAALAMTLLSAWRVSRLPRPWPAFELSYWRFRPRLRLPTGADAYCLLLAAGIALWVLIEALFALHGWPAVARYMFEAAGVMCVLAGVFVGRVVHDLPPVLTSFARRIWPERLSPRLAGRIGAWGTVLAVVLFAGLNLPSAHSRLTVERVDLRHERARTREIGQLKHVIDTLGIKNILACGRPDAPIEYQSILAWYMNTRTGFLYIGPAVLHAHESLVKLYPIPNGWHVVPVPGPTASRATVRRCQKLALLYTK
jgi:hypothetical protein